jgi:hypothetical protein
MLLAGTVFTITEKLRSGGSAAAVSDSKTDGNNSDTESNSSDNYWSGKSRVMTLQAESPQVCVALVVRNICLYCLLTGRAVCMANTFVY